MTEALSPDRHRTGKMIVHCTILQKSRALERCLLTHCFETASPQLPHSLCFPQLFGPKAKERAPPCAPKLCGKDFQLFD